MKEIVYKPHNYQSVLSDVDIGDVLNLPEKTAVLAKNNLANTGIQPYRNVFKEETLPENIEISEKEQETVPTTASLGQTVSPQKQRGGHYDQLSPMLQGVLDIFDKYGLGYNVTSGYRPGSVTSNGSMSHHSTRNAFDITPVGMTYDDWKERIRANPEIQEYFRNNKLGILDETTPEMLKRTGGTGAHWHIGPDKIAVDTFRKWYGKKGGKLPSYQQGGSMTLAEYIAQRAREVRNQALNKSRTRTEPSIPMVQNKLTPEEFEKNKRERVRVLQESFRDALQRGLISNPNSQSRIQGKNPLIVDKISHRNSLSPEERTYNHWRRDLNREINDINAEEYQECVEGATCLYTATDNYGRRVSGNRTFAANPEQYGFQRIPFESREPGDIIQDYFVPTSKPTHALIFDSNDEEGRPRYNYSDGGLRDAIRKNALYPFDENSVGHAYRFVGNSADSLKWKNDYHKIYNQKSGGKIKKYQEGKTIDREYNLPTITVRPDSWYDKAANAVAYKKNKLSEFEEADQHKIIERIARNRPGYEGLAKTANYAVAGAGAAGLGALSGLGRVGQGITSGIRNLSNAYKAAKVAKPVLAATLTGALESAAVADYLTSNPIDNIKASAQQGDVLGTVGNVAEGVLSTVPTASAALKGVRGTQKAARAVANGPAGNVASALIKDKGNPIPAFAGVYHQVINGRPITQTLPRTFGQKRAALTAQNKAYESAIRRLESYYPTLDFRTHSRIVPENRYYYWGGNRGTGGQFYQSGNMHSLGLDGSTLIRRNTGSYVYPPSDIITATTHEGSHLRAAAGRRANHKDRFSRLALLQDSKNTYYGPETNEILKNASNARNGYYREADELLAFTNQNVYSSTTPARLQDPAVRNETFRRAIDKLPSEFKLKTPEKKRSWQEILEQLYQHGAYNSNDIPAVDPAATQRYFDGILKEGGKIKKAQRGMKNPKHIAYEPYIIKNAKTPVNAISASTGVTLGTPRTENANRTKTQTEYINSQPNWTSNVMEEKDVEYPNNSVEMNSEQLRQAEADERISNLILRAKTKGQSWDEEMVNFVDETLGTSRVPLDVIYDLIDSEGAWRVDAKNPGSSASGLFQVVQGTAKDLFGDEIAAEYANRTRLFRHQIQDAVKLLESHTRNIPDDELTYGRVKVAMLGPNYKMDRVIPNHVYNNSLSSDIKKVLPRGSTFGDLVKIYNSGIKN